MHPTLASWRPPTARELRGCVARRRPSLPHAVRHPAAVVHPCASLGRNRRDAGGQAYRQIRKRTRVLTYALGTSPLAMPAGCFHPAGCRRYLVYKPPPPPPGTKACVCTERVRNLPPSQLRHSPAVSLQTASTLEASSSKGTHRCVAGLAPTVLCCQARGASSGEFQRFVHAHSHRQQPAGIKAMHASS